MFRTLHVRAWSGGVLISMRYRKDAPPGVSFRLTHKIFNRGINITSMAWIKTISLAEADEKLKKAIEAERALYPKEYADPVHPDPSGASSIVGSHTLIPDALYHAFSTFGALMSPDLPLSRRQHEMIATMVSVTNRCVY